MRRVFVFGAAGAGSTTLARALASRWSMAAHDTDDYFWTPTNPPCSAPRRAEARVLLMWEIFLPRVDWVLSGWRGCVRGRCAALGPPRWRQAGRSRPSPP